MTASRLPALPHGRPTSVGGDAEAALAAFHRGDRAAIEACYRDYFDVVEAAILPVLNGADSETVIHEVFWRLLSKPELRQSFRGGSMAAWLATVTRNLAVDCRRRLAREVSLPTEDPHEPVPALDNEADARMLIDQFRRERLRPEWGSVFEARFLRQLSQREAATALHLSRTTLAYRELRIRQALREFLMEDES